MVLIYMNPPNLEQLVSRYANGIATKEEIQELADWYRSNHFEDVDWPAAVRDEADILHKRMVERAIQEIRPQKVKTINFHWMRAAAILLLFAGVASLLYYIQPLSPAYVTEKNPSGFIRLLKLPDSTRVWLSASSQLEYAEDFAEHRELRLTGEAYFEVKPDNAHPFVVQAGALKTTVVGTSFNIDAYPADHLATISVTGGLVRVSREGDQPALLAPSQQLQLNKTTRQVTIKTIDTTAIVAWKEGRLQFRGQTLGEIAKRLENLLGYKIIFSKPGMASCRYYMTFKNTHSAEQLFSAMSEVADIDYTINPNLKTVTLTGSECR